MVTSREQARQFVHEVRLFVMELPVFDEKVDAVSKLLDLEWSLRDLDEGNSISEDIDTWEDDLRESPWTD